MNLTRVLGGTAAIITAVAVSLAAGTGQAAAAAPPLVTTDSGAAAGLAATVGTGPAGVFLDTTGHVHVAVTTRGAAAHVRTLGGIPRLVARSAAELDRAVATLNATLAVPGTSWGVDPQADQVVVTTDRTVTGAHLATVRAAVAGLGPVARLASTPNALHQTMSGGDGIGRGGGFAFCTAGFNVQSNNNVNHIWFKYFLTAGHCTRETLNWHEPRSDVFFAQSVFSSYPGHDYGMAQYIDGTAVAHPGFVDLGNGASVDINHAGDAVVGQRLRRVGSTSGLRDGAVTRLNVTVNYGDGNITGLIQSDMCADPGDSGGPLFAGDVAYGLISGAEGGCINTHHTSYYQPVKPALAALHAVIY